jgi:putative Mg2+ transporter-C (MgtC) family protein
MNVFPVLAVSNLLSPLSWQHIALRLGVALLAGAIIGLDRELKQKPAGLRTNMLVSFGSAFFVIVPIELDFAQKNADAFSRVLQGIITGVGFVGAGVILHDSKTATGMKVKGLTTAAAIWISSALGVAIGCGLWQLGLVGAVVSWLTLSLMKQLEV